MAQYIEIKGTCPDCYGEGAITRNGATGRYARCCRTCGGEGEVVVDVVPADEEVAS